MRLAIPRRRLPETPLEKLQFEQANAQSDAEWPFRVLDKYKAWAAQRNAETVERMVDAGGDPDTLTVADGVIRMEKR